MRINKKYINKFDAYKKYVAGRPDFYVGVPITKTEVFEQNLKSIGFELPIQKGDVVLPSILGRFTKYNAEGKEIIRKDLPKETVTYPVSWSWKDWSGKEYEEIRYRDVERYPREIVPAPSLEMEVRENKSGLQTIVIGPFNNENTSETLMVHAINIFLETIGYCDLLTENFDNLLVKDTRILNWDIFPEGEYPWAKVKPKITQVVNLAKKGNRPVIEDRFETIENYKPDFVACGRAGFSGYVVFGFKNLGIYLLESNQLGNATYIFDKNWQALSQLTKEQIIRINSL